MKGIEKPKDEDTMITNGQRTIRGIFRNDERSLKSQSIDYRHINSGIARERRDDDEGEQLLKYLIIYSHYMRSRA